MAPRYFSQFVDLPHKGAISPMSIKTRISGLNSDTLRWCKQIVCARKVSRIQQHHVSASELRALSHS